MERDVVITTSYGRTRIVKNIGIIIHREDGTIIKRCLRCHQIIKDKKEEFIPSGWTKI